MQDMVRAIRQSVTVKPGGIVEVRSDELQAGAHAEVIVLIEPPQEPAAPLSSFVGAAPGSFSSPREADTFIRSERDAWDR